MYIELFGSGGLAELVFADTTSALFVFLSYFPYADFLGATAVLLVFIFLVTSADSGTFVLSMMTTDGNLNPPVLHKMVWGVLIAVLTVGTLISGSVFVARAMAVIGALPFSIILMLQIVSLLREIRVEKQDVTRAPEAIGRVEPTAAQLPQASASATPSAEKAT